MIDPEIMAFGLRILDWCSRMWPYALMTPMVCGIMMGLAIAPRIDRLRHPDRKKAPRQRMPGTKEGKP